MTALLTAFLEQIGPYVLAGGAAFIGALIWGFRQRLAGAKAERAKQALDEAHARDVANQVRNDIGALPPDKARKELNAWSKF
ncbi:ABC transporter permease [Mesorhizobium sp.]|uniref:ABC transporter permease n=1 Tax=Mesorhizobium sp. TaxID=1871066 RepID=UPI000FE6E05F|nr:ABC transporter permease [Mesorhizobium sp.]RWE31533.1 MAG: ABC transporter permease [Mesorhizobium sp.]